MGIFIGLNNIRAQKTPLEVRNVFFLPLRVTPGCWLPFNQGWSPDAELPGPFTEVPKMFLGVYTVNIRWSPRSPESTRCVGMFFRQALDKRILGLQIIGQGGPNQILASPTISIDLESEFRNNNCYISLSLASAFDFQRARVRVLAWFIRLTDLEFEIYLELKIIFELSPGFELSLPWYEIVH